MGADTFMTKASGATAAAAFATAVQKAQYDHGRAGCIDLGDGNYLFFGWASS